jgi:hypothetical protein
VANLLWCYCTHFLVKGWLMLTPREDHSGIRGNVWFVARFPAESQLPTYKPLGLCAGPLPHCQVSFCLSLKVGAR